jgi:hypothetical protein
MNRQEELLRLLLPEKPKNIVVFGFVGKPVEVKEDVKIYLEAMGEKLDLNKEGEMDLDKYISLIEKYGMNTKGVKHIIFKVI